MADSATSNSGSGAEIRTLNRIPQVGTFQPQMFGQGAEPHPQMTGMDQCQEADIECRFKAKPFPTAPAFPSRLKRFEQAFCGHFPRRHPDTLSCPRDSMLDTSKQALSRPAI